jgi:dUTPase
MNNDISRSFKVYQGDRIAQAVLAKVEQVEWQEVSELDSTDRVGGFGSTNYDKDGNYKQ